MVFLENDVVYLEDSNGKRIWVHVSYDMIRVQSGVIDGSRLKYMDDGDTILVAGHEYVIFRPGIIELMESLERGAQVITAKDASTILMHCDIKCGDKVIEVGAGSGGLTTALLHAVAPNGHVHTLEIRDDYIKITRKNIERTGLDKYWSYTICDAREINLQIDYQADVLTMDVPDPWSVLNNIDPYIRSGGRICAYVPNMNQVESIVIFLRGINYYNVHSIENIQRGLEVHPGGVRPSFKMLGHTGYMVFARKTSKKNF